MTTTETKPDELTAALNKIRESAEDLTPSHDDDDCRPGSSCTAHDALRMVAALDEVLKLHQRQPVYGIALLDSGHGVGDLKPWCGHDYDAIGDDGRHFESDSGAWLCLDQPRGAVCDECEGEPDWPCSTYEAVSRVLMGGTA